MTTTNYTVLVNGETVYTGGSFPEAEREYAANVKWLSEPGETASVRDEDDLSIRKASIGEDGKLVTWM